MAYILSVVNLKGGVGKTAIAVNFAAYCGLQGMKTLLVDLDAQTNATFSCLDVDEWKEHAANYGTVANVLGARSTAAEAKECTVETVIRKGVFENVDLVPSHLDLITIDLDLAAKPARESRLRRALKPVTGRYDMVVCDCPPNLNLATQNALAMSTHYVVPISPDYLSGIGVGLLLTRVKEYCDETEKELEFVGIVISRVGRRATHREEVVAALREEFKELVLATQITERVAVSEAAASHQSIFSTRDRKAAWQFGEMSKELLQRLGVGN